MKLRTYLYVAAGAMLALSTLTACNGNSSENDATVRPISDYKDMTIGDSVAYYYGQMASMDFWRSVQGDSVLSSREGRDSYLKGLRAGYDAMRDDDAYNKGYYMGVQLAMQMKELCGDYNITANKTILLNSFEDGLKNDSVLNMAEVQQGFNEVVTTLQAQKDAADKKKAEETLKGEAAAKKWQMINPSLYASAGRGGEGALLKEGESVGFSMTITNAQGKDLDRRDNPDMVVGKMTQGPVTQALLTMKVGETRTFYTFANALLGRFAQRYGLKSDEIVSFTINLTKAEAQPVVEDESAN